MSPRLRRVLGLGVIAILVPLQRREARKAVYPSSPDNGTPCPAGIEDLVFASEDGTRIHGWLARVPGATRSVLMAHGNAGNIELRGSEIQTVARLTSSNTLMFDYRGYGRSEGSPFEAGVAADARAALAALEKATGVPIARTVIIGHSLGGAVAIDLAARTPVAGLVVLSSFTSIDDMVHYRLGAPFGFLCPETWDSQGKIGKVACPKLFAHGDKDDVIPFAQGYALYEKASEPKRFVNVPGGDHYTLDVALGEIVRFVDSCVPAPGVSR